MESNLQQKRYETNSALNQKCATKNVTKEYTKLSWDLNKQYGIKNILWPKTQLRKNLIFFIIESNK